MNKVYAGFDLQVHKISSLVLVSENVWKAYFWLPEKQLSKTDIFTRWKYRNWISQGLIRITLGDLPDYDMMGHDICNIQRNNPFVDIAVDRWGSAAFAQKLMSAGVNVIGVSQGFAAFSPVCHDYIHSKPSFANPVLKWMDRNLSFVTDPAGNKKPNRQKGEIGGIVAGLMAMILTNIPTEKESRGNDNIPSAFGLVC